MSKRIRYSLALMSVCILGLVLTQGFWLYKDYSYYRGQPLFSSDFNFYQRTVPRLMPVYKGKMTPGIKATNMAELPSIIAYPMARTLPASGVTGRGDDLRAVPSVPRQGISISRVEGDSNAIQIAQMQPVYNTEYIPATGLQPEEMGNFIPAPVVAVTDRIYPVEEAVPTVALQSVPQVPAFGPSMIPQSNTTTMAPLAAGTLSNAITVKAVPSVSALAISPRLYKTIPYKAPITYVLQKMKWQFGGSILLILCTISGFIYMLVTIFMQRKLSMSKNDFINNMTHELKTPLATVSVAIEAMRNFGALDDKKKTNLYLDISKKELDHLSKTIEMIMQLSIYETYKMELIRKPHPATEIISGVVEKYNLSHQDQVTIHILHPDEPITANVDATHIGNAIGNLVSNSIKYSDPPTVINITSTQINNCWVLAVQDNGFGIAVKYQKDVFERFFRITDSSKPLVKGFGLGLSYVKQVVELHGGTITLQSQYGKGSTFTISIPLS